MPSGSSSKQEAARVARLEREAAERAQQERKRRLSILGGVIAVVVVIVVIVLAAGVFKSNPAEESKAVNGIKGVTETQALVQGLPQKGTRLGKADAPVTIVEFADLKCPVCQQYALTVEPKVVDQLVRSGKANIELHLVNVIDANAGTSDGQRARTVADNFVPTNTFWNFVSTAYYNQGQESDAWATEKRLREIAAGAPGVDIARFDPRQTAVSRKLQAENDQLAQKLGLQGTPSFYAQPRGTSEYTPIPNFQSVDPIAAAVEAAAKKAK